MSEQIREPPDPSPDDFDPDDADIDDDIRFRASFSEALTEHGFPDTLVLSRGRADEVFTERRLRIVDHLKQAQPHSVRELARDLDEDKGVISRDLEALAQLDVIEYVEQGRAKAPRLKHSHVVVEPVV